MASSVQPKNKAQVLKVVARKELLSRIEEILYFTLTLQLFTNYTNYSLSTTIYHV